MQSNKILKKHFNCLAVEWQPNIMKQRSKWEQPVVPYIMILLILIIIIKKIIIKFIQIERI